MRNAESIDSAFRILHSKFRVSTARRTDSHSRFSDRYGLSLNLSYNLVCLLERSTGFPLMNMRLTLVLNSTGRLSLIVNLNRARQHWRTRWYGTGSGSDRVPVESLSPPAPGRYRSRYCTDVTWFDLVSNKAKAGRTVTLIT
jgi:hypothetical protein